jgi:lysophospholipase L1-like esterase
MILGAKYSILCFGDSNTWGFIPGTCDRYASDVRWPGVVQKELGTDYNVIEEGFNGRTTIWEDATVRGRKGSEYLGPCLGSHRPLDAVILFLGINDLKSQFGATADEIAGGASTLIEIIRESGAGITGAMPPVLLMSPPLIGRLTEFAPRFVGAHEKSARLAGCFQSVAQAKGVNFLDTSELIAVSDVDGIHLDSQAHRTLGIAVAERVRKMITLAG